MFNGFTRQGANDETSYLVGSWSELLACVTTSNYQIGCVQDGVLELSREFYTHEDNAFPRNVDLIVPIRAGMKFSGKVEEVHKQNVSWLLGQSLAPSSNYLYVGALTTASYFTFRGRRNRVADGFAIEFCMWKCLTTSLFQLGSGDDVQGTPLEVVAHRDEDGDYGGSATSPLGWLYVPNMGA